MTNRPPSLLLRLALSALIILVLSLGLIGLAVERAFRASEHMALQERLESASFAVIAGLEVEPNGALDWAGPPTDSLLTQPESGLYAGVVTANDAWQSPSTLGVELTLDHELLPRGSSRWQEPREQQPWHVYRLGLGWELPNGEVIDLTVWVAEDRRRLDQAVASFRGDLWRWLLLAAMVMLVAQMIMLSQPLLVLRRVGTELRDVEAGRREHLQGRYPRELTPLTENLNALLKTERANAEQYSRALGDLAHSLKTPLAVLNAQLEAGNSIGKAELREAVDQMQARIRSELDRAARSGRRTMLPPLEVAPVVERVARTLGKLYPDMNFETSVEPALRANIAERDLLEILGNLLENAAKYGRKRVRVEVEVHSSSARRSGLRIVIDDDGPGLDRQRFGQMLQRGVRGDEMAEGQGLGLSIVQRIVESYHGVMRAGTSPLGGLRVETELKPS
ncbi:MAG: ATP-binding protein [Wenzhouxiangellaceae bacterium]|nr:ATP-binding protein [Wenzhouxiangellaceae bacterium]